MVPRYGSWENYGKAWETYDKSVIKRKTMLSLKVKQAQGYFVVFGEKTQAK